MPALIKDQNGKNLLRSCASCQFCETTELRAPFLETVVPQDPAGGGIALGNTVLDTSKREAECHKLPPGLVVDARLHGTIVYGDWPSVKLNDWCGAWEPFEPTNNDDGVEY